MTFSIRGGILFSAALTFLALSAGPIDAGLIAYSNDANQAIQTHTSDGSLLHTFDTGGATILDFGFTPSGDVIALTQFDVLRFHADGTQSSDARPTMQIGGWGPGSRLSVGPDGQVAYSNDANQAIQTHASDGSLLHTFNAGATMLDFGFTPSGDVIALTEFEILQFHADGTQSSDARPTMQIGGWGPGSRLAVQTFESTGASEVPEPSSIALLGIGGLVLCGCRRRRRCLWKPTA